MNKKLLLKSLALFFILLFSSLLLLTYYKNKVIEKQKTNIQLKNKDNIALFRKKAQNFSELFYYSYVNSNEKLHSIIKEQSSYETKFRKLDKLLENKLNFFKKHHLKEINIYSIDAKPIYKSAFKSYNNSLSGLHKKTLEELSTKFNSKTLFLINDSSASLVYIRPIFDKNLKPFAIFETSIDLPKLAHDTFLKQNYQIDFLFKKTFFEKNINKTFVNSYKAHYINEDYVVKNSFYSNRYLNKKIPLELFLKIKNEMKKRNDFTLDYIIDNKYYMISFLNINSYTYSMLKIECESIENIINRYDIYKLLSIITSFLLAAFSYFINSVYIQNKLIRSKLDSLNKTIDKYMIVTETDLKGNITYASQTFCKVNGYKKEELIGKSMNIVRHSDITNKFYENMWKKLKNNEIWEGEIKNKDKNGNSYWVRGNIVPIYDIDDKKIGYRSIKVNISDEKQLLKVNALLKKDLYLKLNEIKTRDKMNMDQSKIVLMGQILDAFSNEWKKPISILSSKILAFETRLNKNSLSDEFLKALPNELNAELKTLSIHLNEFKSLFSHNNTNQDKYNVYTAIKVAISSVSKKDVKIKILGDQTLETYGVSHDLRKIILGIIYNSVEQFEEKNIQDPRIEIEIKKINEHILISCKDNAGGIPDEFLSEIFEADFSTKENVSSRGLPLHIAKLIVKKLSGDIWVRNVENGCCFYLKLITKDRRTKRRD